MKVVKVEEIDGIGKATAEKLNTLGIKTIADFASLELKDAMSIKYLGASQLVKLYESVGQEVTVKDIKEYRATLNKCTIPRTPVTKEQKTHVKFIPAKNDEFNLNNIERVMFSDEVYKYWFTGNYNDEEMPVVEEMNACDIENALEDAFPKHKSDDIVDDAFKKMGFKLEYGDSENYVLCEECKENLICKDEDDYLMTDDGEICKGCIEEEGGYVEAAALHEAFGIPYGDMNYAGYSYYDSLEVIDVHGDDDAQYVIGTEDEADEAVKEYIKEMICYFNPDFIGNHLDINEYKINDIIERFDEETKLRNEFEELSNDKEGYEEELDDEDLDGDEKEYLESELTRCEKRLEEIEDEMETDPENDDWFNDYQDEIYNEIGRFVEGAHEILYGTPYWIYTEAIAKVYCDEDDEDELIYALRDFDEFVDDAIGTDGRGSMISSYDGDETEVDVNGETYYIYRTN